MKKAYSLLTIFLFAIVVSCTDDSLDPLNFKSVKKGTLLALRGQFLQNIYQLGLPGAQFVPGLTDGSEKFTFDAEYLSGDPTTLSSIDVFVVDKDGKRNALTSVAASGFTTSTSTGRPVVTVSIPLSDILPKLGYPATFPIGDDVAADMFVNYKNGITIETDLNLTDGSKVTPGDLVAAGLYQSNQFYPAQSLVYTVIKYCPEDIGGTFDYVTVVTGVGDGGDISGCDGAGVTGQASFTKIPGGYGVYKISDVTFGQYDCAWADNPATGSTVTNTCNQLSVGGTDQYGLVYSFTGIKVSDDQTQLSFNWANDYGDKGSTVLTRTDDKLWPKGLH
jgi:hypothetical protein